MKKDEFIKLHQSYLNNYIKFAYAKALAIITINGFILKFNSSNINNAQYFFDFIGFISLVISIVLAAYVVYPRTNNKSEKGIIFWDNVNRVKEEEFLNQIKLETEETLQDKIIQQNYFLAKTASRKYKILRIIFFVSAGGYFCLLLSSIFRVLNS
ncbi:Pycsar system effector family protein [Staphylococcus simulans]|uniref:Pycsar system effector family protein n=1 Tax=Staphylococcus simulans TaxID=1286 RepID=UPI0021D21C89|nr:Pycsar system effector family protein [Staphylococcus simulans]UXV42429.1 DUF5706 domain-containing protein [Staphylococcus simulans]